MSYTKNVYYPTEEVTDISRTNCYTAYMSFFSDNAAINSRFDVTVSVSTYEIDLIPKETHLQNYKFVIWVNTSNELTLKCNNLGVSSNATISESLSGGNLPFTIIESGEFFLMDFSMDSAQIFLAPGQTFSGDAADNSVFLHYCSEDSSDILRQGSGGINYVYVTDNPMRTCAAETGLYRLTRLSSMDSRYDRIFPDLYCIDGGSKLPAWGTPFKVGKDTFLMVCKNICVKV